MKQQRNFSRVLVSTSTVDSHPDWTQQAAKFVLNLCIENQNQWTFRDKEKNLICTRDEHVFWGITRSAKDGTKYVNPVTTGVPVVSGIYWTDKY